jgi:predicted dehydrogenase
MPLPPQAKSSRLFLLHTKVSAFIGGFIDKELIEMSKMEKVRIGVIGAGSIGKHHVGTYQKVAGVEVVAVADPAVQAAEAVAKQFNIPNVFSSHQDMLAKVELDGVSVCTPNCLHAQQTVDALKAGVNVLCEKPMSTTVKEAEAMVRAARAAKKVLMLGFVRLFDSGVEVVRKYLDDGQLGKVYHAVVFEVRRRGIPGLGGWFTTKTMSGGGPLIDIGVHALYSTVWMMGAPRPVAVSASCYQKFGNRKPYVYVSMWGSPVPGGTFDVEDFATALIRFDNGATCMLECAWAANAAGGSNVQILGDKAGVKLEGGNISFYGENEGYITDFVPQYAKGDAFVAQARHFADCIRGAVSCRCPGEYGLMIQKILNGVYNSAKANKELRI